MDSAGESLVERMARRLSAAAPVQRPQRAWAVDWRVAVALAATISLAPLATILGASLLEGRARASAERLHAVAAPRLAAAAREEAARAMLRDAARDVPVSVWLDKVARALPADARLSRMTKAADGAVEMEITAPDPDLVRGALRRDPAFAGFRETDQRRAGAMILIRYRRAA